MDFFFDLPADTMTLPCLSEFLLLLRHCTLLIFLSACLIVSFSSLPLPRLCYYAIMSYFFPFGHIPICRLQLLLHVDNLQISITCPELSSSKLHTSNFLPVNFMGMSYLFFKLKTSKSELTIMPIFSPSFSPCPTCPLPYISGPFLSVLRSKT